MHSASVDNNSSNFYLRNYIGELTHEITTIPCVKDGCMEFHNVDTQGLGVRTKICDADVGHNKSDFFRHGKINQKISS